MELIQLALDFIQLFRQFRTATFADFARLTVAVAGRLFGAEGPEQRAVGAGWDAVGVPWS